MQASLVSVALPSRVHLTRIGQQPRPRPLVHSERSWQLGSRLIARASTPDPDDPEAKRKAQDLYVPPDALNGDTPENKAAKSLTTLITYVSVRIVMEQMCGSRHRSPMYNRLRDYINEEEPLRDGKEWLAKLMRHPDNEMRLVALRIIETRELYLDTTWDWADLREATEIKLKSDTQELKKQWMAECMSIDLGSVDEDLDQEDAVSEKS